MAFFAVTEVLAAVKYQCKREGTPITTGLWHLKPVDVVVSLVKETAKFYVVSVGHHDNELWVEKADPKLTITRNESEVTIKGRVIDLRKKKLIP